MKGKDAGEPGVGRSSDVRALELPRSLNKHVRIRTDLRAAELTTIGVGEVRPQLLEPLSPQALAELQTVLADLKQPVRILGYGSNVVISQNSADHVFLRFGKEFSGHEFLEPEVADSRDVRVFVRAGTSLMALSRELSRAGFSGLEFAAGIPASIGGAVAMNAGAHGGTMSDIIAAVELVTTAGETLSVPASQLKFAYRRTELPLGAIVSGATLRLQRGDPEQIQRVRAEFLEHRRRTQPLHLPSVGSVFKNIHEDVVVHYAGRMLEAAGLRGYTLGGVHYSEMHANWIVRCAETGSIEDVMSLISIGRDKVFAQFGKTLEPEVHLW